MLVVEDASLLVIPASLSDLFSTGVCWWEFLALSWCHVVSIDT